MGRYGCTSDGSGYVDRVEASRTLGVISLYAREYGCKPDGSGYVDPIKAAPHPWSYLMVCQGVTLNNGNAVVGRDGKRELSSG